MSRFEIPMGAEMDDQQIPEFPFDPGPDGAPPPQYEHLRAQCPVSRMRTPAGDVMHLAVRADDIRAVYTDRRLRRNFNVPGAPQFSAGDISTDPAAMFNMDAPEHTRLRRIVAAAFTRDAAEQWRPAAERLAGGFVDSMAACGAPADLMSQFAVPLPVRIICRVLGISEDAVPQFRAWSDTLLSTSTSSAPQRAQAAGEFAEYIRGLVEWQRSGRGEPGTLLADLVAARDGADRLSEEELIRTVSLVIMAGHETTAHVIGRGVLRLLRTPGAWRRLVEQPDLVPGAVEHLLRIEVPGHGAMPRLAADDVVLPSGAVIRAGEAVLAPTVAYNHDPALFPNPDVLDLDAQRGSHLTFGLGAHFCLGAHLARVELQAAFTVLTRRLPGLALAVPLGELKWTAASKVSGLLELPVRW